ncbi:hypothetical protein QUC31_008362 [Theobroma cacao]
MVPLKKENGQTVMVPLFQSQENIAGKISIEPFQGKKIEHNGVKVELLGQIVRELDVPGDIYERKTYPFEFSTVEMPYETYNGVNVRLRYVLKVTVSRNYGGSIVEYQDFMVRNYSPAPSINNSIKMEVGIEDCLHIEFEYNKSKYHLKDVIIGKIYFLLVRIKIKNMDLEIRRRESTGSGANTHVETETLAKFELMDGAPVRGESIPIRLFLSPYELTPTHRNINNKFSVKYYLNLVLVDEEDRRISRGFATFASEAEAKSESENMYAVRGMRHKLLIFQSQCSRQALSARNDGSRMLLKVLENLDAVVDVGGVYDPTRDRYDHHQRGFEQVFGHGFTTKLSSAGLVYKHYGAEIIAKVLQLDVQHPNVSRLFLAVYKNFVEAVDAIGNGINQYDTDQPPRYVNSTGLSFRVGRLNLDWVDPDQSSEKENEAFQHAMTLTGSEFLENIHFLAKSWLPARSIVMECLSARNDIDSSGEIMVLTRPCPWKLHIFELEEELKVETSIKYVIYQDDRSENWRVQAIAVSPGKFESRKPLPLPWRGLEGNKLSEVAGIPGCVFVHMSGFIAANKSFGGALAMARASLKV